MVRALMLSSLLVACGGGTGDSDGSSNIVAGNEGGNDDGGGGGLAIEWTVDRIASDDAGLQMQLEAAGARVYASYWSNQPFEDGPCDELDRPTPPPRMRHTLYVAERTGSTWSVETAEEPVVAFVPNGVGLAIQDDGEPAVAFTGGAPEYVYCGGNDAVVGERSSSGWTFDTAAAESGDAAAGEPASDAGFVVGIWPGIAYDPGGEPAVVYRDAHFGTLQHDDLYRADFEFAVRSGGSWVNEPVDIGEGAGDYGKIVFDPEGRAVAVYAITIVAQEQSRHGVWAARRDAPGSWSMVKLHTGAIDENLSLAVDPGTGEIVAAWYGVADLAVKVRTLIDPDRFTDESAWTTETVGNGQYDEGRYASLAFAPDGRAALAYHRCKLVTAGGGGCDMNDEAVIFALRTEGYWDTQVVHEAGTGSCGEYTSLAFDDAGTAWIGFRCTEDQGGGAFALRPYAASGTL